MFTKFFSSVIIGVCLAASLLSAQSLTTVAQQVTDVDGSLASGQVTITLSSICQSGTSFIQPEPLVVNMTSGEFMISLVPNDTCVPSTYYVVNWSTYGANWTDYWYVPSCTATLPISQVQATSLPSNGYGPSSLYWDTVTQSSWTSLTDSQWSDIQLNACSGGLNWNSVTSQQWNSFTSSQWNAMLQ